MARIRTIKPEFPQSESIGRVSRDARLLFIQLWTICDDSGRTRAASRMLASLLFPYDDDAPSLIETWLGELEREGCIARYVVDGCTYLEIAKWLSHQKIDRPSESRIPPFDESSRILASDREPSSLDLGPRTKDQGGEKEGEARETRRRAPRVASPECPDDVSQQVWSDWLSLRAKKKAPVTETVIDGARREAEKAGMSMDEFLGEWCTRGSQGLKADWMAPKAGAAIHPLPNRQSALEARNKAVAEAWLIDQEAAG